MYVCIEALERERARVQREIQDISAQPRAATGVGIIDHPGCKWVCSLYVTFCGPENIRDLYPAQVLDDSLNHPVLIS